MLAGRSARTSSRNALWRTALLAVGLLGAAGGAMAQPASTTITPAPPTLPPELQPAPTTKPAAKPPTKAPASIDLSGKNGKPKPKPDPAFAAFQRGQFVTAMNLAIPRANSGDPVAMVLLGELLSQGYGVRQDNVAAGKWFEAAAAKGSADAMFTLAAIKMATKSTQQKDDAVALFKQAAEKGNSSAAYNLGLIYLQGQVAPKEPAIAAEWFKRAAQKDQPDALYALATLYRDGNGVSKNLNEMVRLLEQADAVGNAVATTEYAIAVFNGNGVPKDEERAARLFKKAALAGNAIAQNRFARLLSAGRGMPQDKVAAATWYLAAKNQKLDDEMMEKMMASLTPQEREQAQAKFKVWTSQAAK